MKVGDLVSIKARSDARAFEAIGIVVEVTHYDPDPSLEAGGATSVYLIDAADPEQIENVRYYIYASGLLQVTYDHGLMRFGNSIQGDDEGASIVVEVVSER